MPNGLYLKYTLAKTDGSPVDPFGEYFVLRLDTDPAALSALMAYADLMEPIQPELATDLYLQITKIVQHRAYDLRSVFSEMDVMYHDAASQSMNTHTHYGQIKICPYCGEKGSVKYANKRVVHGEFWVWMKAGVMVTLPAQVCCADGRHSDPAPLLPRKPMPDDPPSDPPLTESV